MQEVIANTFLAFARLVELGYGRKPPKERAMPASRPKLMPFSSPAPVPVARTAHESVERLRTWASGRCLDADAPGGIYNRNPNVVSKPGRRVCRADPSNN